MKHSEFRAAMEAAFGRRASSVDADLVLADLDGRTPQQALADGIAPRMVWEAICQACDLGSDLRWHHRRQQPRRGSRG
ncbi:MAG: DUF3046 domain-containing protein [Beutenbergiaceae bacterium]